MPRQTRKALDFLAQEQWLKESAWYLAGGTALALYIGHRQSIDLDFFTPNKNFAVNEVLRHFSEEVWETGIAKEGTIYGSVLGAKASFIAYPFFVSKGEFCWYGNVRVLGMRDIAVMKIIAVSQRGRKRDFVDLYWYANNKEGLLTLLQSLPSQYPTVAHDYQHILKSLMYFADADPDPMPELFFKADWRTIKAYFQKEVPKVARELLGI